MYFSSRLSSLQPASNINVLLPGDHYKPTHQIACQHTHTGCVETLPVRKLNSAHVSLRDVQIRAMMYWLDCEFRDSLIANAGWFPLPATRGPAFRLSSTSIPESRLLFDFRATRVCHSATPRSHVSRMHILFLTILIHASISSGPSTIFLFVHLRAGSIQATNALITR